MTDNVFNEVISEEIYEIYYDGNEAEYISIDGNKAFEDNNNKWIKESTEYLYDIKDSGSGIRSYIIKVNGVTVVDSEILNEGSLKETQITEVTGKFILDTNTIQTDSLGRFVITASVTDNAGNVISDIEIYEVHYDKMAPVVTEIREESGYTDVMGNKWINDITRYYYEIEDTDSGISDFIITVNGTRVVDSIELEKYDFKNNKVTKVSESFEINPKKISTDENGKYVIIVTMKDNTGNIKTDEKVYEVYYDKESPIVKEIKGTVAYTDPDNNKWIKEKTKYSYVIEDSESGISRYAIKINGVTVADSELLKNYDFINGTVKEAKGEFLLTPSDIECDEEGKYVITATVEDNTGNITKDIVIYEVYYDCNMSNVTKFDSKPIYIDSSDNKWFNGKNNYEYLYKIEDLDSGISSFEISVNGTKVVDSKELSDYDFVENQVFMAEGLFSINPNKISAKADGSYEIKIIVTDNVGNINKENTYVIYKDSTIPKVVKFTMKADKYVEGNGVPTLTDNYSYYFKTATNVVVSLLDEGSSSGINKIAYFLCDDIDTPQNAIKSKTIVNNVNNEITINVPQGFKGQIYVAAIDNVGNGNLEDVGSYVKPEAIIIDNNISDKDVITIKRPSTTYKDNSNLDLYNGDVGIVFKIKDITSGIRSIKWEVISDNDTDNNYSGKIEIDNLGNISDDGSCNIISKDKNLITEISKNLLIKNNDNKIIVNIQVEDRAGNISYATDSFSIDKTKPEITITYDNNVTDSVNSNIFKENRKATIYVKERNFNSSDVVIDIKNTDGKVPVISSWQKTNGTGNGDDTLYTATILYDYDGDYTFSMSYKDNASNLSDILFSDDTVAATEFTIDKTKPILNVNYDNNLATNVNYYKDYRMVTFAIEEHNFDESRFSLVLSQNGVIIQKDINWNNSGDTHIATLLLEEEALYNIQADYMDMAGNKADNIYSAEFYIDKKAPELTVSGIKNETAYNDDIIGFMITSIDTYFDSLNISLKVLNKDGSTTILIKNNEEMENVTLKHQNVEDGKQLSVENLTDDGIYVLECQSMDKSGRISENSILFSINRGGPTYYIEDEKTLSIKDKYLLEAQDIIFTEINVTEILSDSVKIIVYKGNSTWNLEEGVDYTVEKVEGKEQWCKYIYKINKENFTENGIYHVTIASKDAIENDSISDKFSFVIDNEAPVCTIFDLKDGKVYVANNKVVNFKITDNIELEKVVVTLNGKEVMILTGNEIAKNLSEDNTLSISVLSSNEKQNLTIKCEDKAGNETEIIVKDFYITTNLWIRFINNTRLIVGIISAIVFITVVIIFIIIKKNGNHKDNKGNNDKSKKLEK